jgi:hypothetical protein
LLSILDMPMRRFGGTPILFITLTLACESTPGEGPREALNDDTIVNAKVGTVGITVREEGSPESPNSFAVDKSGRVHVLDQLNHQVLTFTPGASKTRKTELPARDFQDIELVSDDGSKGYVVLDLYNKPGVVFVDAKGKVENEVVLAKSDIPTPGLVSSLVRNESGVWVSVEGTHLVQVADAAGVPVESSVLPGALTHADRVFRSNINGHTIEVQQMELPDGAPKALAKLTFSGRVNHQTLLGWDDNQALLVGVTVESPQTDPDTAPEMTRHLVRVTKDGNEGVRTELPVARGAQAGFRNVKLGADGNVYVMTSTDNALQITRIRP